MHLYHHKRKVQDLLLKDPKYILQIYQSQLHSPIYLYPKDLCIINGSNFYQVQTFTWLWLRHASILMRVPHNLVSIVNSQTTVATERIKTDAYAATAVRL